MFRTVYITPQFQSEKDRYMRAYIRRCLIDVKSPLLSLVPRHERFVAQGATSTVHSATVAGRTVAVKQYSLHFDRRALSATRKRFLQETAMLKSVSHPNVIGFIGVLDDPTRLCIVTSWMPNGELNVYLKRRPDAARRPLARQVASGLRYLRSRWIVHGDLKGANTLIDEHGQACIADFGSAYDVSHGTSALGATGGTFRWMAPELLIRTTQGCRPTFESDVFAFGMVLYEIFSGGEIPFHHLRNPMAANVAIIIGERPPRPNDTPDHIWALATACWRADPASRPAAPLILI